MECPNCHEPTEAGALFCGNCGRQLVASVNTAATEVINPLSEAPPYALAIPAQHAGETRTLLILLAGVTGLVGALFIPLVGVLLGGAGLVVGTVYRRSTQQRRLNSMGIFFSTVALLSALATWTYAYTNDSRAKQQVAASATGSVTATLSTPCYSLSFIDRLNVVNEEKSCDMNAFNGTSLNDSTNAYKVFSSKSAGLTAANFTALAKQALEKDVKSSLPGFTIDSQRVSGFAGSPAYTINVSDKSRGVAVVETAVYHPVASGQNIFIVVHALNGQSADLRILEAQWQWK